VVEAPAWEKRRERFEGERKPIGDLGIEVDKNGKKKIFYVIFLIQFTRGMILLGQLTHVSGLGST
jgi:hypothetical protein